MKRFALWKTPWKTSGEEIAKGFLVPTVRHVEGSSSNYAQELRVVTMRIPGSKSPERGGQVDRARSSSSKSSRGASASKAGGANVTASVSAKARSLASEHGIDIDKVNQLREAIQNGDFSMDFSLIAERIVQDGA